MQSLLSWTLQHSIITKMKDTANSLLQLVVVMILLNQAACQTRDVWYGYNGRCYYIPTAMSNYDDAVTNCGKLGASPAELGDETEMEVMQYILDSSYGQFWVGLEYYTNGSSRGFHWTELQSEAPPQMWFSTEPNFSGQCVRLVCGEMYKNITGYNVTGQACSLADNQCRNNYSVICERDAVPLSNYTYIHISQLNIPEFLWFRMLLLQFGSRIECAAACTAQQTSGSCGAFVFDETASDGSCVMYSLDDIFTEAITPEQYSLLYIALGNWKC